MSLSIVVSRCIHFIMKGMILFHLYGQVVSHCAHTRITVSLISRQVKDMWIETMCYKFHLEVCLCNVVSNERPDPNTQQLA